MILETATPLIFPPKLAHNAGTVLLVDDEQTLLRALASALSAFGFSVIPAKDGIEALELFEQHQIDFVVSDVCMPRLNGIDLATELLTRCRETRLILMSGTPLSDKGNTMVSSNLVKWLPKPATVESVVGLLKSFSAPGDS